MTNHPNPTFSAYTTADDDPRTATKIFFDGELRDRAELEAARALYARYASLDVDNPRLFVLQSLRREGHNRVRATDLARAASRWNGEIHSLGLRRA